MDNINDPRCRVDIKKLLELPELKVNPFNVQLCRVFSGGRESLQFEEFLDMMSVLSEYTPSNVNIPLTSLIHMTHHSDLQVKAEWAFKMFDFDGDGKLNKDDIYKTVSALTGSTDIEGREAQDRLEREKVSGERREFLLSVLQREVVRNVLEETDLNGSGYISLVEFKQLVTKSTDFKDNFRIKL